MSRLVVSSVLAGASVAGAFDLEIALGPDVNELNWTNQHGGPIVDIGDSISRFISPHAAALAPTTITIDEILRQPVAASNYTYYYKYKQVGFGNDIAIVEVETTQQAIDACSALIECRAFTFDSGADVNGTITNKTKVFLKRWPTDPTPYRHDKPWATWWKSALVTPPAQVLQFQGLNLALRQGSYTAQWLNASRDNVSDFSFVPTLDSTSALPLQQHLGDVTLRLRPATAAGDWAFFASAWGPFGAEAAEVPLQAGEAAAHDITPLLEQTRAADGTGAYGSKSPLRVRRSYGSGDGTRPGLEMSFELTNVAAEAVEIGGFGMSLPAAVSQDVHMGGGHGWVEWLRVHVSDKLEMDEQCFVATPLNMDSGLENFRPMFEFGGGGGKAQGQEWSVHTKAWAAEWERNTQWPFLYMNEALNRTGLWPNPRSPFPAVGAGGQTMRTNFSAETHWNPPSARVLQPGQSVTYGVRLSACPGGPRTRDAALRAAGEPVLKGVPGFTLSTDMTTAQLLVFPPAGITVVNANVSGTSQTLSAAAPRVTTSGVVSVPIRGLRQGRARLVVTFSDGSTAVAHYMVTPPFPEQIQRLSRHLSEVAWLPRDYPDPFGRGASVLPWDREDLCHRFNDARAYDVGLSDDPGAGNTLALATSQAFAPIQSAVERQDEYIAHTLYGVKTDTAMPPYKSLQKPDPDNGVRMTLFYYNQSYFPWNYTEQDKCEEVGGLNTWNWCMTESQANATYRGFNYPHQIAVWYSMYRSARNHPRLKVRESWQWYLERAANTTLRLGFAKIGYMDGTVTREVLNAVLEEAEVNPSGPWHELGSKILKGEKFRADYFKTASNPYGSEFAYDTTGQEEVVIWQLYFDYDDSANRTINHVLQYMRPLPNWAYNGGAIAGDGGIGGKWQASAGTGVGGFGKMHYRSGLNQIPLIEWFRRHPDDLDTLEIAVGAMSGQMSNIDSAGAPSLYFHAYPHVMDFDPYSGDYGLGFFGSSLESSATLVRHAQLGPLCYLCDLLDADGYKLAPRDAYRQRVYLEPLGLYLQADAGIFETVELRLQEQHVLVTFAAATATPAGEQTYEVLRLRADKVSRPEARRPGTGFVPLTPAAERVRGAWEFPAPADGSALTVTLSYVMEAADMLV